MSRILNENLVSKARLIAPDGESYEVVSFSLSRSAGLDPDTATVRMALRDDGLKFLKFFPGQITAATEDQVPKTDFGSVEFGHGPYTLDIESVVFLGSGEDTVESQDSLLIEQLFLSAGGIKIQDASVPREGGGSSVEAPQILQLSLTDIRAFWKSRGALSGRRNFTDEDKGIPTTVKQGDVSSVFNIALDSLKPDRKPRNLAELMDEAISRLFGTVFSSDLGGLFGPENVRKKLEEEIPVDDKIFNYGRSKPAKKILEEIASTRGLVYGLDWDGFVLVDFQNDPSSELAKERSPLKEELSDFIVDEKFAYNAFPGPTSYEFIPNRIIKEVMITRWEPLVTSDGSDNLGNEGELVSLTKALPEWNFKLSDIKEASYSLKVQPHEQKPADQTLIEKGAELIGQFSVTEEGAARKRRQVVSIADGAFQMFRPTLSEEERETLLDLSEQKRNEAIKEREEIKSTEAIDPEKPPVDPSELEPKVLPLVFEGDPLRYLLPPFKIIEKPEGKESKAKSFSVVADYAVLRNLWWDDEIDADIDKFSNQIIAPVPFGIIIKFAEIRKRHEAAGMVIGQVLGERPGWPRKGGDKKEQGWGDLSLQEDLVKADIGARNISGGTKSIPSLGVSGIQAVLDDYGYIDRWREKIPPKTVITYWNVWSGASANDWVEEGSKGFDPATGILRFKIPMGVPRPSKSVITLFEGLLSSIRKRLFQLAAGTTGFPFSLNEFNYFFAARLKLRELKLDRMVKFDADNFAFHNSLADKAAKRYEEVSPIDFFELRKRMTPKVNEQLNTYMAGGPLWIEDDSGGTPDTPPGGSIVNLPLVATGAGAGGPVSAPPSVVNDLGQLVTPPGARTSMEPPSILMRFFVEISPDEVIQPSIVFGEGPPAKQVVLKKDWIERFDDTATSKEKFTVDNRQELIDEAKRILRQELTRPGSGRSDLFVLQGFQDLATSSIIKQITLEMTEGGNDATTKATGNVFGTGLKVGMFRRKTDGTVEWFG